LSGRVTHLGKRADLRQARDHSSRTKILVRARGPALIGTIAPPQAIAPESRDSKYTQLAFFRSSDGSLVEADGHMKGDSAYMRWARTNSRKSAGND